MKRKWRSWNRAGDISETREVVRESNLIQKGTSCKLDVRLGHRGEISNRAESQRGDTLSRVIT